MIQSLQQTVGLFVYILWGPGDSALDVLLLMAASQLYAVPLWITLNIHIGVIPKNSTYIVLKAIPFFDYMYRISLVLQIGTI